MEHMEEAAGGVMAQLDQFYAGVRRLIADELPLMAKVDKVKQLREKALNEIEALIRNFDQTAQDKEKELMEQLARLRQLRDQVTVIRQGVLPMFAHHSRRE